ncbi:MAG TPA: tryptophan 7-halogenase [Myxococcota bacterium]|nr:tryptophan 7-halogenase [Myxococcota bacterium]
MEQASGDYDVVIAGGGVGGMALAARLAERGYRIVMVEKKPPPEFRLGESLDWEAPVYLKRLGLPVDQWVAQGKATEKAGAVCTSSAQPGVEAELGFHPIFKALMTLVGRAKPTLHANRELIDIDLMDNARKHGAEIILGKVSAVLTEGERVAGVKLDDGRTLRGKFYVDATGAAAMFRKKLGIGFDAIGPRKVVVRARFPHAYDGMGTRIRTDDTLGTAAWMWDINVSDDVTDIGIVVAEHDFVKLRRHYGTLHEILLHQVRKHDDLAWLVPLITPDTPMWTCVFQCGTAQGSSGPNWMAVGEAFVVVDGILSSGFTTALRSGFLASDIIGKALMSGASELDPKLRRIYQGKVSAHIATIDKLVDVLWYGHKLREHYPLFLNVVSILFFNFNLNHIHTRYCPRTIPELYAFRAFHHAIDAFVRAYAWVLAGLARLTRKRNKRFRPERFDELAEQTPA